MPFASINIANEIHCEDVNKDSITRGQHHHLRVPGIEDKNTISCDYYQQQQRHQLRIQSTTTDLVMTVLSTKKLTGTGIDFVNKNAFLGVCVHKNVYQCQQEHSPALSVVSKNAYVVSVVNKQLVTRTLTFQCCQQERLPVSVVHHHAFACVQGVLCQLQCFCLPTRPAAHLHC